MARQVHLGRENQGNDAKLVFSARHALKQSLRGSECWAEQTHEVERSVDSFQKGQCA